MLTVIKKGTPKEEIKRQINEVVSRTSPGNLMKYAGKLNTGKKRIDPLAYQKKLRNEWE